MMSNTIKRLTPIKAIRTKCLECSGRHPSAVKNCEITDCPLFTYRFGKNPQRRGIGGKKTTVPLVDTMNIAGIKDTNVVTKYYSHTTPDGQDKVLAVTRV